MAQPSGEGVTVTIGPHVNGLDPKSDSSSSTRSVAASVLVLEWQAKAGLPPLIGVPDGAYLSRAARRVTSAVSDSQFDFAVR